MKSLDFPMLSCSSITSDTVRNRKDEDLGTIKDLMIDTAVGQVVYAVLSFGGTFGFGDKLFAVPWEAFDIDTTNECLVLEVDKARLEDAPGFEDDNWPTEADPDFINRMHEHWGHEPYYDSGGSTRVRKSKTATTV